MGLQRRVRLDLLQRGRGERGLAAAALQFQGLEFTDDGPAVGEIEEAGRIARQAGPGGQQHPVDDRDNDTCVKHPEPPARERVVELLDPVPLVTGRLDA